MSNDDSKLISVDPKAGNKSVRTWCSKFNLSDIYKKNFNSSRHQLADHKTKQLMRSFGEKEGDRLSRDSSNIVSKYLEDLRSSVMWGIVQVILPGLITSIKIDSLTDNSWLILAFLSSESLMH